MPFGTNDEVLVSAPKVFGADDDVIATPNVPFQKRTGQEEGDQLRSWTPTVGQRLSMAAPSLFSTEVQPATGMPRGVVPRIGQAASSFLHFAPLSAEQWTGQPPQNVVQGINEGIAKQITPANIGIGLAAAPLFLAKEATIPINVAKAAIAAYFAGQGAQSAGQEAAKVVDPTQTPGQRTEAGLNVALGGLMGVAPLVHAPSEAKFFGPEDVQRYSANLKGVEKRQAYEPPHIFGRGDVVVGQNLVGPEQGGPIYPQYGGTMKVEPLGGQVSFNAPGEAESVPSARQAATPERPLRKISEQERLMQGRYEPSTEVQRNAIQERETETLPVGPSPGDSGQMEPRVREQGLQQPAVGEEAQATPKESEVMPSEGQEEVEKGQERVLEQEGERPSTKLYGGFFPLDPDFWKTQIGIAKDVKVDAQQMYNRIRNKLGEESLAWKTLNTPEFKAQFVGGGKMTTDEAREAVERVAPKVEVRKFGEGKTPERTELDSLISRRGQIEHEFETLGFRIRHDMAYKDGKYYGSLELPKEQFEKLKERGRLNKRIEELQSEFAANNVSGKQTYWSSIAPKSEMPGYVEGAVVVPHDEERVLTNQEYEEGKSGNQVRGILFPSSHSFPPNTLGFFRGYMETLPNRKKVFRVIEVQSDWAARQREAQEVANKSASEPKQGWEPQGYGGKSWYIEDNRRNGPGAGVKTYFDTEEQARNAMERQRAVVLKQEGGTTHPLLPQWERLTVKAAIDHAIKEGADAIAFDDAETAMLTEGHDRARPREGAWGVFNSRGEFYGSYPYEAEARQFVNDEQITRNGWTYRKLTEEERQPTQSQGMKLHYDRILPKLGEELTGSKGTKEEFGEHKLAVEGEFRPGENELPEHVTPQGSLIRQDLIFRNPDGTLKTTSTANVFNLSKVKGKDWSILQSDKMKAETSIGKGIKSAVERNKEAGAVNIQMVKDAIDEVFNKVGQGIHAIPELFKSQGFRSGINRFAGVAAPKTTTRMPIVGNQLVMMAKADDIAHVVSQDYANQVLENHVNDADFRFRLGFVGAEDRFRREGKSMIGTPQAQGVTEAQYQQWLHAKDIRDALERHKQVVQPGALQRHTQLGGKPAASGVETDAFFNLIPVEQGQTKAQVGSSKGQLATLKRGTAFGRKFKGTAETYDFDYQHMMDRMVRGNWAEVEKQKLYNLVESTGFGKIQRSGEARPTGVENMEGIPIQRKQIVYEKSGKSKSAVMNETMWVPKETVDEFKQAFQVNSPMKGWVRTFGRTITEAQISLGVDAAVHITNQAGALLSGIVRDPRPLKQVQGIVKDIGRSLSKDPSFTHELAVLAEKYGIVRSGEGQERSLLRKILQPGSGLVHALDRVSRVALDRMYQDAVNRGAAPDSVIWRRANVHGKIGEYNKALLQHWQQTLKEWGVSPFLVAGLNFNRLALRQAIMAPGMKTTSLREGAKLSARAAIATAVFVISLPSIVNYAQTGSPLPQGVKVGQMVVHKNKDGTYETIDFAKWFMQRRAFDITGVDALATGIEQSQSAGQIAGKMGGQIIRGAVRPYAGPVISTALMATKGEDLLGYRKSKDKSAGEKMKAAGKELNPTLAATFGESTEGNLAERLATKTGRIVGIGKSRLPTSEIKSMAIAFNEREGQPVEDRPASQYKGLTQALASGDAGMVRAQVKELQKRGVKNDTIKKYYDELPYKNITGRDAETEQRFISQLSPEQKKVYEQVRGQEFEAQKNFYNIILQLPAPMRKMQKRVPMKKRQPAFPGEDVQEEP